MKLLCVLFFGVRISSHGHRLNPVLLLSRSLYAYVTMMNQMLTVISMSYEDVQSGIYFKKQIIIRKLCLAVEE